MVELLLDAFKFASLNFYEKYKKFLEIKSVGKIVVWKNINQKNRKGEFSLKVFSLYTILTLKLRLINSAFILLIEVSLRLPLLITFLGWSNLICRLEVGTGLAWPVARKNSAL